MLRLLLAVLLSCTLPAAAFDNGHHEDLTRQFALNNGKFSEDAIKLLIGGNHFTDFYSFYASDDEQIKELHSFHFDGLYTAEQCAHQWIAFASNVKTELTRLGGLSTPSLQDRAKDVLLTLGAAAHAAQDFYSHSNWAELFPRGDNIAEGGGQIGKHCDCMRKNTVASFDYDTFVALDNKLFAGEPGVSEITQNTTNRWLSDDWGKHGNYCLGVNHDSNARPNFLEAAFYGHVGQIEFFRGMLLHLNTTAPDLYGATLAYALSAADKTALEADLARLKTLFETVTTGSRSNNGHWKGPGSGESDVFAKELLLVKADDAEGPRKRFLEMKDADVWSRLADGLYDFEGLDLAVDKAAWPPFAAYDGNLRAIVVRTTTATSKDPSDPLGADMWLKVKVDGQTFLDATERDRDEVDDALWVTVKFVDATTSTVAIEYQIFDDEEALAVDSDSKLTIMYDTSSHELTGDIEGTFDSTNNTKLLDTSEVTVTLYVTSYLQCSGGVGDGEAEPKYKEDDKTNCGARPIAHICTISDLEAKLNALAQLWYVFLIVGVVLVLCIAAIVFAVCHHKKKKKSGGKEMS